MIVNETVLTKEDLYFITNQLRKEKRYAFAIVFSLVGGVLLLIISGAMLFYAVKSGGRAVYIFYFALFIVAGLFFIAWGVSFNRRSVNASLKQPVSKVPRNYAFSEEYILRRLSCGGVDSEDHYKYSLIERYFELNDAIYIKLNVNDRQAFIVLHNDSYSEGSAEELKALLESRGIHK